MKDGQYLDCAYSLRGATLSGLWTLFLVEMKKELLEAEDMCKHLGRLILHTDHRASDGRTQLFVCDTGYMNRLISDFERRCFSGGSPS